MKGKPEKRFKTTLRAIMLIVLFGAMLVYTAIAAFTQTVDTDKVHNQLSISVEKFVNYNMENKKGAMLQLNVQTGIEYDEGVEYVPLLATKVLLNAPKINGKLPESVEVAEKSTKATNGSNLGKNVKYAYNSTTGQIGVSIENLSDEEGNIYKDFVQGARDNFSVILNYDENCYSQEEIKKELEITGTMQTELATEVETKVSNDIKETVEVEKEISNLISNNITTSDIYNGFIKTNSQSGSNYKTEYEETSEINISKKEMADETTVEITSDFIKNNENVNTKDIIYTTSTINKDKVLDILGENGYLKIQNENNEVLGQINKDTQADENGNVKIKYVNEQTKIFVVFSKPEKVGFINIESQKQIKETVKDTSLEKVQTVSKITFKDYTYRQTKDIEIKDSITNVELKLDNAEWTNEKQNNVNFNIVLHATDSSNNLFKDPAVGIKLPDEVEKVILDDATIIHGNGLKLKDTYYNEESKVIYVVLEGEQTEYLSKNITNGTNITIPANIILSQDIENSKTALNYSYINNATGEKGSKKYDINIINFRQEEEKTEENTQAAQVNNMLRAALKSAPSATQSNETQQTVDGIEMTVTPKRGDAVLTEGSTVYEGEFIKYEIALKNTTDNALENVKVIGQVPEGTTFGVLVREDNEKDIESKYEYDTEKTSVELNVGTIQAGKTSTIYYEVRVNDLADGETEKNISSNIVSYVGDGVCGTFGMTNKVEEAQTTIFMSSKVSEKNEFEYILTINGKVKVNDEIKVKLPKGFKLSNYNGSIINSVGTLEPDSDNIYTFTSKTSGEYSKDACKISIFAWADSTKIDKNKDVDKSYINVSSYASIGDYKSNECRILLEYNNVTINMTSDTKRDVKSGDKIEYKIEVKNIGKTNYNNGEADYVTARITDKLPTNIENITYDYNYFEQDEETGEIKEKTITDKKAYPTTLNSEDTKPNIDIKTIIPYEKTITIYIHAEAGDVTNEYEINNQADVANIPLIIEGVEYPPDFSSIPSNKITNIIIPIDAETEEQETETEDEQREEQDEKEQDGEEEEKEEEQEQEQDKDKEEQGSDEEQNKDKEEKKYSISGIVWYDENSDGQRQNSEARINDVTVYLSDNNGKVVKTQSTTSNGTYSFSQIPQGKYYVIFKYNNSIYGITKYQFNGVADELNSDAFEQESTLENEKFTAGVTDLLTLNSSISNIDLGLIKNKTFDFKVESYISNITIETENDKKDISYNNVSLAKAEINAKEVEGAKVTVTYKILITNNGEVDGKVKKIIDTLPVGFKIDTTTNGIWGKNTDGTLVNTNLANETIKSGKTVEITLVADVTLSENSLGLYNNKVEIEAESNQVNIKETSLKNNSSKTDLILSVSTGAWIYITITLVLLISIFIILNFKLKLFRSLKTRLVSFIAIIGITLFAYGNIGGKVKAVTTPDYSHTGYFFIHDATTYGGSQALSARYRTTDEMSMPVKLYLGSIGHSKTDEYYAYYIVIYDRNDMDKNIYLDVEGKKIYIGSQSDRDQIGLDIMNNRENTSDKIKECTYDDGIYRQNVYKNDGTITIEGLYEPAGSGTKISDNDTGFWNSVNSDCNYMQSTGGGNETVQRYAKNLWDASQIQVQGKKRHVVKITSGSSQESTVKTSGDQLKIPNDWRAFHYLGTNYNEALTAYNNIEYRHANVDGLCINKDIPVDDGGWLEEGLISNNTDSNQMALIGRTCTSWRCAIVDRYWEKGNSNYISGTAKSKIIGTTEDEAMPEYVLTVNNGSALKVAKKKISGIVYYEFTGVQTTITVQEKGNADFNNLNYTFKLEVAGNPDKNKTMIATTSNTGLSRTWTLRISEDQFKDLYSDGDCLKIRVKTSLQYSWNNTIKISGVKKLYKKPGYQTIMMIDETPTDIPDNGSGSANVELTWSLNSSVKLQKIDEYKGDSNCADIDMSGIEFRIARTNGKNNEEKEIYGWLKFSDGANCYNVSGEVNNSDSAGVVTSDSTGNIKEIVGLQKGYYEVFETVPSNVAAAKYYNYNNERVKLYKNNKYSKTYRNFFIGAGTFYNGGLYNYREIKNERGRTDLVVIKKDDKANETLPGVKLKILDVTDANNKRWVRKFTNSDKYYGLTNNTSYSTTAGTEATSVFVTDDKGEVTIEGIDIYDKDGNKRIFEVYEIGFTKSSYNDLYKLGKFRYNNIDRTGNKLKIADGYTDYTFRLFPGPRGKVKNTVINTQYYGALEITKKSRLNYNISMQDIRVKIKVENGANAGKWLNLNSSNEVTDYKSFSDVDSIKVGSNNKIPTIKQIPILDDDGNEIKYSVYEVYIPDRLRGLFMLKYNFQENNVIYNATREEDALLLENGITIEPGVEFENGVAKSEITPKNVYNKQNTGSLQITKKETNTQVPLSGIGFKVLQHKISGTAGFSNQRWLQINSRGDVTGYAAANDFDSGTTIYTNENGMTDIVKKLPLVDDKGYYLTYSIFEVEIRNDELKKYFCINPDSAHPSYAANMREAIVIEAEISGEDFQQGIPNSVTFSPKPLSKTYNNDQTWISLSGRVWEDGKTGKNDRAINNYYNINDDYNLQGIQVRLVDNNQNIVTYINENGTRIPQIKTTNSNGEYKFDYIKLNPVNRNDTDYINNYHVEFSYDGITYQPVKQNLSDTVSERVPNTTKNVLLPAPTTSKAEEKSTQRNDLNNNETFRNITGEGQSITYTKETDVISYSREGIITSAKVVPQTNTTTIHYKYDDIRPKIVNTSAYNWERNGRTVKINTEGFAPVRASISNSYIYSRYQAMKNTGYFRNGKTLLKVIPNMNLGLYQREEADLALAKDTYSAQIDINGKTFTYYYAQNMDAQVQSRISDGENYMRNIPTILGTAFERKYPLSDEFKYKTPVYEADMKYNNKEDPNKNLKVSIVYAIALVNDSQNLYGQIRSIKDYYSTNMEFEGIYTDAACTRTLQGVSIKRDRYNGTLYNQTVNDVYTTLDIDLTTARTTDLILAPKSTTKLSNGESNVKYLYIKMNLPKEKFYNGSVFDGSKEYRNYAEITSYASYSSRGVRYAHFDYDSVPNTITTNNSNLQRVEDDSNFAPGLKLELAKERTISGVVFEDESLPNNGLNVLLGNGRREDSDKENGIEGVIVQLVPIDKDNLKYEDPKRFTELSKDSIDKVANDYYNNNIDTTKNCLTVNTNESGEFTIRGFIPGDYQIRYVWGGTSYSSRDYKSTVYDKTQLEDSNSKNWYLSEKQGTNYSEAVDSWNVRNSIDKELKTNYGDLTINNENSSNLMHSWTRPMDLGVELRGVEGHDYKYLNALKNDAKVGLAYTISSIDFGLIARPSQQLEITKELKKVKIIDGQDRVIIEAEVVEENGKKVLKNKDEVLYTVYLPESDAQVAGILKSELDKDYLPVRIESTYQVTVKNSGQQDYANQEFYYYGTNGKYWYQNPVQIQPSAVYDYLSKSYDLTGDEYTFISNEEYSDKVTQQIKDADYLKGTNAETTKTVVEYGYTKDGTTVKEWKSTYRTLASLYEEWYEKVQGTYSTRKAKLDGRKVIELSQLEGNYKAGDVKTCTYTATSVVTDSKDDFSLDNDVEIINIDRVGEFGKTLIPTYKTLYDAGESVLVTPPTGENRDKTESNIWIISITSVLAALGVGIVLIKKVLKKTK